MSLLSCFICMLHSLEHHIPMAGGLITIFIFDLISAWPWPTGDGYMCMCMYLRTYVGVYVCTICMYDSLFYPRELYTTLRLCVYFCSFVASVSKMPNINICFVLRFWATGKQHCMLGICMMGMVICTPTRTRPHSKSHHVVNRTIDSHHTLHGTKSLITL